VRRGEELRYLGLTPSFAEFPLLLLKPDVLLLIVVVFITVVVIVGIRAVLEGSVATHCVYMDV